MLEKSKELQLSIEDLVELRKQQELIENQVRILAALRLQMEHYISSRYGINLQDNWTLDLMKGLLYGQ